MRYCTHNFFNGAAFRAAREALGISPIEAADLLNLTLRTIEALEKDDYESTQGRSPRSAPALRRV